MKKRLSLKAENATVKDNIIGSHDTAIVYFHDREKEKSSSEEEKLSSNDVQNEDSSGIDKTEELIGELGSSSIDIEATQQSCLSGNVIASSKTDISRGLMRSQQRSRLAAQKLSATVNSDDSPDLASSPHIIMPKAIRTALPTFYPEALTGLKFQNIPGDGHCLFHAIGIHLGQDADFLRKEVSDYLEQNITDFQSYRPGTEIEFRRHIEAIRSGDEWGDHLEIEVIQRLTNKAIIIIRGDSNPTIPGNVEEYTEEPIFIYYNGRNHYDGFLLEEGNNGKEILTQIQAALAQGQTVTYSPERKVAKHFQKKSPLSDFTADISLEYNENLNFSQNTSKDNTGHDSLGLLRLRTGGVQFNPPPGIISSKQYLSQVENSQLVTLTAQQASLLKAIYGRAKYQLHQSVHTGKNETIRSKIPNVIIGDIGIGVTTAISCFFHESDFNYYPYKLWFDASNIETLELQYIQFALQSKLITFYELERWGVQYAIEKVRNTFLSKTSNYLVVLNESNIDFETLQRRFLPQKASSKDDERGLIFIVVRNNNQINWYSQLDKSDSSVNLIIAEQNSKLSDYPGVEEKLSFAMIQTEVIEKVSRSVVSQSNESVIAEPQQELITSMKRHFPVPGLWQYPNAVYLLNKIIENRSNPTDKQVVIDQYSRLYHETMKRRKLYPHLQAVFELFQHHALQQKYNTEKINSFLLFVTCFSLSIIKQYADGKLQHSALEVTTSVKLPMQLLRFYFSDAQSNLDMLKSFDFIEQHSSYVLMHRQWCELILENNGTKNIELLKMFNKIIKLITVESNKSQEEVIQPSLLENTKMSHYFFKIHSIASYFYPIDSESHTISIGKEIDLEEYERNFIEFSFSLFQKNKEFIEDNKSISYLEDLLNRIRHCEKKYKIGMLMHKMQIHELLIDIYFEKLNYVKINELCKGIITAITDTINVESDNTHLPELFAKKISFTLWEIRLLQLQNHQLSQKSENNNEDRINAKLENIISDDYFEDFQQSNQLIAVEIYLYLCQVNVNHDFYLDKAVGCLTDYSPSITDSRRYAEVLFEISKSAYRCQNIDKALWYSQSAYLYMLDLITAENHFDFNLLSLKNNIQFFLVRIKKIESVAIAPFYYDRKLLNLANAGHDFLVKDAIAHENYYPKIFDDYVTDDPGRWALAAQILFYHGYYDMGAERIKKLLSRLRYSNLDNDSRQLFNSSIGYDNNRLCDPFLQIVMATCSKEGSDTTYCIRSAVLSLWISFFYSVENNKTTEKFFHQAFIGFLSIIDKWKLQSEVHPQEWWLLGEIAYLSGIATYAEIQSAYLLISLYCYINLDKTLELVANLNREGVPYKFIKKRLSRLNNYFQQRSLQWQEKLALLAKEEYFRENGLKFLSGEFKKIIKKFPMQAQNQAAFLSSIREEFDQQQVYGSNDVAIKNSKVTDCIIGSAGATKVTVGRDFVSARAHTDTPPKKRTVPSQLTETLDIASEVKQAINFAVSGNLISIDDKGAKTIKEVFTQTGMQPDSADIMTKKFAKNARDYAWLSRLTFNFTLRSGSTLAKFISYLILFSATFSHNDALFYPVLLINVMLSISLLIDDCFTYLTIPQSRKGMIGNSYVTHCCDCTIYFFPVIIAAHLLYSLALALLIIGQEQENHNAAAIVGLLVFLRSLGFSYSSHIFLSKIKNNLSQHEAKVSLMRQLRESPLAFFKSLSNEEIPEFTNRGEQENERIPFL